MLRPHVQCVSLGGVARPESYEVTGPLATLVLQQLWLDVAIVGVNALSAREGATCRHEEEAAIIRTMIERSKQVICVATGEKLGRRTFASICPAERIDHLVTTVGADRDEVRGAARGRRRGSRGLTRSTRLCVIVIESIEHSVIIALAEAKTPPLGWATPCGRVGA